MVLLRDTNTLLYHALTEGITWLQEIGLEQIGQGFLVITVMDFIPGDGKQSGTLAQPKRT